LQSSWCIMGPNKSSKERKSEDVMKFSARVHSF
jgi:hypothetical protein